MKKTAIEIRNLTAGYRTKSGNKQITSNLQAEIPEGRLTCLLGANGVGKSTLLRTLSGFQPPLSGDVLIFGTNINSFSGKELSRTVGIVLTERISARDLTVRELVSLGRNPYTGFWGRLGKSDERKVSDAIAQINIENLAERTIHTLSDGERQKVLLAKVLSQETPLILLDEPTAFLDFKSKIEIMLLLRRLAHEKGKTVFLTTHDVELALQIADELRLMDADKLIAGTPSELKENGELERFFRFDGVVFDKETGNFKLTFK
ncbi:MAG: ABC transporter ATP-binding protein [Dysgonamonadaceae bacterium]|jgi:iron complex transport system ATP-binding protein|nr:ABC transporter ATP-binding protein [Dysgonamonadaceae bacterium]